MDWAVEFHDAAWDDVSHLGDDDRQMVLAEVTGWIVDGPNDDPVVEYRTYPVLPTFQAFVHEALSGHTVVYVIDDLGDDASVIRIVRVRECLG